MKGIIAGTKALISAIAADGWVAVLIIVVICLVALIFGSVYGIFFSGEDSGTGITTQSIVQEINSEYEDKLNEETVVEESDDGNGNIVQKETTVTRTYLYITVSHKSAYEMAAIYNFNNEQTEYLTELLSDKNNSLWSAALYGIKTSNDQIVTVALSQEGNSGDTCRTKTYPVGNSNIYGYGILAY